MQRIKIDFDNPGLPKRLDVMENDAQSRFFEAELYQGGKAYSAPSGATYSIMYHGFGPQNEGWYDTINDGAGKRVACTVSGNVVTCEIARQALQVPGHMTVILCVTDSTGYMLKGWPITANVRNDDYNDGEEVEMYFNLSGNVNNSIDQLKKAMADAEQAQKDIETKAAEALASIPEDYTELDASVKQLKEDLGNVESTTFTIEKGSTNVFDSTNITIGKILKLDIGISKLESYQASAKGFVANQIWDVKKGDVLYTTSAYCGLCVYDANGVLQEHFNNGNKNHTITVDSAHFLRLYSSSSHATYTTNFMLSINKPLQTEHEEYKPDKKISNFIKLEEKINENGQNVKDLSESVKGIELSKNLLDNSSVIENKRPSNWDGQTINDSYKSDGYYTFRAIPVTQNSTYYFVENGDLINFGQLATYDKDGKYVSLLSPSVFNVNRVKVGYIIPENVAYVRGESNTSNFSNVNFKLFNGRFEKKFLKYNESAYDWKNLPVIVFDFDQVVEIDARFTILKKYGFAGNVVETATNNYEITKELVKMGYDISPYLGNHTWDYSTEDGIQKLTANIAEKLGGLEAVGIYNPTMISCSGHKYSDTMEKILSSYRIDYVRCTGFIKDRVLKGKSMYENSYGTRIVVPIGLGSYNGVDEFNATIDSLVDGNVPLIMPFMHTFGYDADWITQEAFEKVVSHVSELVKNGKALCMNMHDFVAYNDAVKSIHDDYIRNMSAIFN
nr:MAG TPA: hypothetical protein [Caudoviricetes sp.]